MSSTLHRMSYYASNGLSLSFVSIGWNDGGMGDPRMEVPSVAFYVLLQPCSLLYTVKNVPMGRDERT